ncbi:MAG: hypothetical protein JRI40_10805, partial [Deltaproteobacteria bacterium]|nr:hypothetical protein [Deltaproteobacteria bacterium]
VVSVVDGENKTIKNIANQRIRQSESFGYLGFDVTAPLMHLTSGELVELIVSDTYWSKFRNHFRGNKEIIKNKLQEIGNIRNSLAHFRPIKADDIELVKQNSRHTLIGVEECLKNLFIQNLRIPTNTTEDWYQSISTLGTEQTTTTPYYSGNEEWVSINLRFISPVFNKEQYRETLYCFKLGKVNTPNILIEKKELTKHITYIKESANQPTLSKKFDMEVSKDINLVFRKDILLKHHEIISAQIKEVLSTINDECELLAQDHLARGKLVEAVETSAWWHKPENKEGSWNYIYKTLEEDYTSKHPDEYWGQLASTSDVVAGCIRYPWMPADISTIEGLLD